MRWQVPEYFGTTVLGMKVHLNLSREIRALPNVEYAAPWRLPNGFTKSMLHEMWETLTPRAQKLCDWIKTEPGVCPSGASMMHPLASKRVEASKT